MENMFRKSPNKGFENILTIERNFRYAKESH